MSIKDNLNNLGIKLPEPIHPVANYLSYKKVSNLVYISGQLPIEDGKLKYTGHVIIEQPLEAAQDAARLCGLNILAQLNKACEGNLDLVTNCILISGFVACAQDFTEHPKVINACSYLMVEVFGDMGKHARTATGASSLPLAATVEIAAIFELKKNI